MLSPVKNKCVQTGAGPHSSFSTEGAIILLFHGESWGVIFLLEFLLMSSIECMVTVSARV